MRSPTFLWMMSSLQSGVWRSCCDKKQVLDKNQGRTGYGAHLFPRFEKLRRAQQRTRRESRLHACVRACVRVCVLCTGREIEFRTWFPPLWGLASPKPARQAGRPDPRGELEKQRSLKTVRGQNALSSAVIAHGLRKTWVRHPF